jgi:hypothetical protein
MMKKFLVVFAVALLMMCVAGQANATYFGSDELIRVVYDVTSKTGTNGTVYSYEQATDLGTVTSIIASPSLLGSGTGGTTVISGTTYTDQYNLSTGAGSVSSAYAFNSTNGSNSQLLVVYFAANLPSVTSFWGSGPQGGTETNADSAYTGLKNGVYNTQVAYMNPTTAGYNDGNGNVWYSTTTGTSYWKTFDHNNPTQAGGFNNFYGTGAGNAEALLTNNNTYVGPAFQSLYAWTGLSSSTTATVSPALNLETIIDANGNIITTASSATPIPPSALLLGSGLLGLIGIGRQGLFKS